MNRSPHPPDPKSCELCRALREPQDVERVMHHAGYDTVVMKPTTRPYRPAWAPKELTR